MTENDLLPLSILWQDLWFMYQYFMKKKTIRKKHQEYKKVRKQSLTPRPPDYMSNVFSSCPSDYRLWWSNKNSSELCIKLRLNVLKCLENGDEKVFNMKYLKHQIVDLKCTYIYKCMYLCWKRVKYNFLLSTNVKLNMNIMNKFLLDFYSL